jgi:hypothetical protein
MAVCGTLPAGEITVCRVALREANLPSRSHWIGSPLGAARLPVDRPRHLLDTASQQDLLYAINEDSLSPVVFGASFFVLIRLPRAARVT